MHDRSLKVSVEEVKVEYINRGWRYYHADYNLEKSLDPIESSKSNLVGKTRHKKWKPYKDGRIPCRSKFYGGCGQGFL